MSNPTTSINGKAGIFTPAQFEAGLAKARAAGAKVVERINPIYGKEVVK